MKMFSMIVDRMMLSYGKHILWSFSIICCKVRESFQTLIGAWMTQSFKQFDLELIRVVELGLPSTSQQLGTQVWKLWIQDYLPLSLVNAIVIEYILTCLPKGLSMFWHLHWISKVCNIIVAWNTFEIKYDNIFYF
jgi:hypothetical protein